MPSPFLKCSKYTFPFWHQSDFNARRRENLEFSDFYEGKTTLIIVYANLYGYFYDGHLKEITFNQGSSTLSKVIGLPHNDLGK